MPYFWITTIYRTFPLLQNDSKFCTIFQGGPVLCYKKNTIFKFTLVPSFTYFLVFLCVFPLFGFSNNFHHTLPFTQLILLGERIRIMSAFYWRLLCILITKPFNLKMNNKES